MSDKEMYQKKMLAQLDEWKADIDKLRAQAAGASADAQLALNRQIAKLEETLETGKEKLAELADAADDAWDALKESVESVWDSLMSSEQEAEPKDEA